MAQRVWPVNTDLPNSADTGQTTNHLIVPRDAIN